MITSRHLGLRTSVGGNRGPMLSQCTYQMFWPNIGPLSVLDHYTAWCLVYVCMCKHQGGGVRWAMHGQEMCGRECCTYIVELRRLIGCNTYVRVMYYVDMFVCQF